MARSCSTRMEWWTFQQDHCIGCGYCITGCPFNIPKLNSVTKRVYKCTLCTDRVSEGLEPACIKSCPTGCLHFGTKDDMKDLAEQRAKQLKDHYGFANAGVYDPPGVGGTGVIYVLHDATKPELYGGLPQQSVDSAVRETLEAPAEVDRQSGDRGRIDRIVRALPALRTESAR